VRHSFGWLSAHDYPEMISYISCNDQRKEEGVVAKEVEERKVEGVIAKEVEERKEEGVIVKEAEERKAEGVVAKEAEERKVPPECQPVQAYLSPGINHREILSHMSERLVIPSTNQVFLFSSSSIHPINSKFYTEVTKTGGSLNIIRRVSVIMKQVVL
jgi:hypothetical protein